MSLSHEDRPMSRIVFAFLVVVVVTGAVWLPNDATAQNTSLFHSDQAVRQVQSVEGGASPASPQAQYPSTPDPITSAPFGNAPPPHPGLTAVSWTYTPPMPRRVFQKHDIVTIRVDEIARVMAEGNAESRKITQYRAVLSEWLRISKGRITPDPQEEGDPSVAGQSNNQYRAEAEIDSRESLTFNIAAQVVDIRPNGNLVLEATKTFRVNDNHWETSLSGICRAQDVAPDNVVLSRDMLDLKINKQDQGHLRDGYKRGWFTRWFDRVQPF